MPTISRYSVNDIKEATERLVHQDQLTTSRYSINDIKEEAEQLVHQGRLSRQQCLYCLCDFLPCSQWECIEAELEDNGFLLRDHLVDLLSSEKWSDD
jgi:hypothetical protein